MKKGPAADQSTEPKITHAMLFLCSLWHVGKEKSMIFCDDDTCKYNSGGIACTKDDIHISVKGERVYEQGKLIVNNVCSDYEDKEDAGTD